MEPALTIERTKRTKTYEAMFLLDPAQVPDGAAAEAEVKRLLERAEARLIGLKNWGERKLAYEIRHLKRGVYVLTFFEARVDKIAGLERDVELSEKVSRVLVLRREKMTQEAIEKILAKEPPVRMPLRGEEPEGAGGGRGGDIGEQGGPGEGGWRRGRRGRPRGADGGGEAREGEVRDRAAGAEPTREVASGQGESGPAGEDVGGGGGRMKDEKMN